MVRDMKKMKVASKRIRRDCAICALSKNIDGKWARLNTREHLPNRMMDAENPAMIVEYPLSFMIAYTTGIVRLPRIAGKARMPTYGTWLVV